MGDFLHKEAQRQGSKKVANKFADLPNPSPYKLPDEMTEQVKKMATADCYRCKGSGVAGWSHEGRFVNLCKCVKRLLDRMEKAVTTLHTKTETALKEAKDGSDKLESIQHEVLPNEEGGKE